MKGFFLFLDTETSGKPPELSTPIESIEKWPYILQVAWQLYDANGKCLEIENHFIHDHKIIIDQESLAIHGITPEMLVSKGEQRKRVMIRLNKVLNKFKPMIVGHYVDFDIKMLEVAMYRAGLKHKINKLQSFCTMRASTEYTKFPSQNYPQLSDLYHGLFGQKMLNQHDAAADVAATAKCFFKLLETGQINRQTIKLQQKHQTKHHNKGKGCLLPLLIFFTILLTALKAWI